jgi:hypothetical protein
MLVFLAAAACGYPGMYPRCFPTTLSESIMGKTGQIDHSIIAPAGTHKWAVSCGSRGVLVRGGTFSGATPHSTCNNVVRQQNNFGSRSVTALQGETAIDVVCAINGEAWTYASSTGTNQMESVPAESHVDVLVIGSGMAGHAAAVAASRADASLKVKMVSPGTSTTQMSTGVVWFPLDHTREELLESYGADLAVTEHLDAYLEKGNASYNYWDTLLNFNTYPSANNPVPDYHLYSTGAKAGNSFQAQACSGSCGSETLAELATLATFTTETGTNVTAVEPHQQGYIVTSVSGETVAQTTAHTVVFAVGGSGHFDGIYSSEHILAGPENWGIHLKTATELGLTIVGTNLRWGLEFAGTSSGDWSANWFSFGCQPVGVSGYEPCYDYNRRVSAYPDTQSYNAEFLATPGGRQACDPGTSFDWWHQFLSPSYGGDAIQTESVLCGGDTKKYLAAGMIDGRRSFRVSPDTMESTEASGLYAAGTTSSYALGNSYFGPGATLGWALHSGRLAGQAAAVSAKAKADELQRVGDTTVAPTQKKGWRVQMFRWGAWILFAAVAAHVVPRKLESCTSSGFRSWLYNLHYILAPTAIVVLLVPALSAWSQPREDRIMLNSILDKHKTHRRLGYVVVVLLFLQLVLGPTAKWLNMTGHSKVWLGITHRILGWTILGSTAYLYCSSSDLATLHDVKVGKRGQRHQAIAFAIKTAALATAATLFFVWRASRMGFATELLGLSWRTSAKKKKKRVRFAVAGQNEDARRLLL